MLDDMQLYCTQMFHTDAAPLLLCVVSAVVCCFNCFAICGEIMEISSKHVIAHICCMQQAECGLHKCLLSLT